MNRHYKDTWYYLKRAGETGRKGITETLSPIERAVREFLGREREPRPTPSERIEMKLEEVQLTTKREIKTTIKRVRRRFEQYRDDWAA